MSLPRGCADQPFDAQFLGAPVWRLDEPARAEEAVRAAKEAGVGLIHYRGETDAGAILEPLGFRHVETLITFEGPMPDGPPPSTVRRATPEDADAVAEIARTSFTTDRWHADPLIPDEAADAFKAAWARNNAMGRADLTLVAEAEGRIAGFNQVLICEDVAVIDLIAVAAPFRGRGLGEALARAASMSGRTWLRVGTQAGNAGSIALYRRIGLEAVSTAETWHYPAP